jgi:hypothetical protein
MGSLTRSPHRSRTFIAPKGYKGAPHRIPAGRAADRRKPVLSLESADDAWRAGVTYRGQPPAPWEIYNREAEMGVTVQRLNEQLDAGEPFAEKRIPIEPGDTVRSLPTRAYGDTADTIGVRVIRARLSGNHG